MRSDFSKVVTERPRVRSSSGYKDVRRKVKASFDEDVTAHSEGMRAPHMRHNDWYKEFSDLLGPLYRFLRNRVGKNWDKVHSEICANLKGRNTQQQHIIDHLYRMVERNVRVGADGKLYVMTRFSGIRPVTDIWAEFYVDPRDGILKAAKKRKRVYEKEPVTEFSKDDKTYKLMDGIWYEYSENRHKEFRLQIWGDINSGKWVEIVTPKKRQLAAKELRTLKIENAAPED